MDSRMAAGETKQQPTALKELCCRFIGKNFPFESVQLHSQRVPEDLQLRIAFWSFPSSESRLLQYADLEVTYNKETKQPIVRDFSPTSPTKLTVTNMMQIGMSLSGSVKSSCSSSSSSQHYVSVKCDRGVVTSTSSTCDCIGKWCDHVVWLCLTRIRGGDSPCPIHPPVSESLSYLDREDLQKALQYFLEEVPGNLLPSLQKIVSKLRDKNSDISLRPGAPDLTSGGCESDAPRWEVKNRMLETQLDAFLSSLENQDVNSPPDLSANLADNATIRNFLLTHDPNVVLVAGWAHSKFYHLRLEVYGHSRWMKEMSSHSRFATATFCNVLLPVLEILFVDPRFTSSLKSEVEGMVREITESRDTYQALQPALAVHRERLRPTVDHFRKYLKVFAENSSSDSSSSSGGDGGGGRSWRNLFSSSLFSTSSSSSTTNDSSASFSTTAFHCLSSLLRYWQMHDLLDRPGVQECLGSFCAAIFPQSPPDRIALGTIASLHPALKLFGVQDCLRHCQFFLSCWQPPQTDQLQKILVLFTFKLLMYSGQGLLPRSPSKLVLLSSHYQDSLLKVTGPLLEGVSLGEEAQQVMVRLLEEFLDRDAWKDSSVFALGALKLALLTSDRSVLKTAKSVMQFAIGNPTLLLSQETVDMPRSQIEDLLLHTAQRVSVILLVFFRQLDHNSGQDLLQSLLQAFPTPCDFLTSITLHRQPDVSPTGSKIIAAVSKATDLTNMKETTEFSHRILPLMEKGYATSWILKKAGIASSSSSSSSSSSVAAQLTAGESRLLAAYSTALTVASHHRWFMKEMCRHKRQTAEKTPRLVAFQLYLLHLSVCHCDNPKWAKQYQLIQYPIGDGRWSALQESDFPPEHQAAGLRFLQSHWMFAVYPQNVLSIFFERGCISVLPCNLHLACSIIEDVLRTVCDPVFPTVPCLPSTLTSAVNFVAKNGSAECFVGVVDHLFRQPVLVTEPKSSSRSQDDSRDLEIILAVLISIGQVCYRLKREHPDSDLLHRQVLLRRWKESLDRLSQVHTQPYSIASALQLKFVDLAVPLSILACETDTVEDYFRLALSSHVRHALLSVSMGLIAAQLWRQYIVSRGLPSRSSAVSDPLFARLYTPMLEDMRVSAVDTAQSNRMEESRVKPVLSQLAVIHRLLGLGTEMYRGVARDIISLCDRGLKQRLQEQFTRIPLENIECFWIIPPAYVDPCRQLLDSNA